MPHSTAEPHIDSDSIFIESSAAPESKELRWTPREPLTFFLKIPFDLKLTWTPSVAVMNTSFVLTIVASIALLHVVSARAISADETTTSQSTKHESPLACNAFALSPELRKRHFEELGPALLKLKKSTRELSNGYEFELPVDNKSYQLLTEWAYQERLCCPFFDIELRLDRENGPLWLRLTGRPGTKEFIKMELGI